LTSSRLEVALCPFSRSAASEEIEMDYIASVIMTGVGATAVMDIWTVARKRVLGVPLPDYGLVGRWLAYMPQGRFHHPRIAATPPINGERVLGWTAHYAIGVIFAAALFAVAGLDWGRHPTIPPALAVGIATVAAPFLLMQPGMGAGIAASRTPRPHAARVQSVLTHLVFGFGLYLAGWAASLVIFGE
jgi:hypothetical protein